jgi:hypothetical protein
MSVPLYPICGMSLSPMECLCAQWPVGVLQEWDVRREQAAKIGKLPAWDAAGAVLSLINSRPQTPTQEEIATVIHAIVLTAIMARIPLLPLFEIKRYE